MATNPMQRKARNSFLLGVLITILLTGAIIAILFSQLINMKKKEQEQATSSQTVYVLNRDVKSGEKITSSDFKTSEALKSVSPTNLFNPANLDDEKNNTAKIAMTAGTIVSSEMVNIDGEATKKSTRKQEYNMLILPMDLQTGDYIDVRLILPSGQDYIVVSKKQVEIPVVGMTDSKDTIWLNLNEDEILSMTNAIVEAYKIKGSKLYVTKYTDAGSQEAADTTYPVSKEVLTLIDKNKNIEDEARNGLYRRYNTEQRNNAINGALSNAADQAQTNLEDKMEESITNSKTSRQEYLEGLSGSSLSE